jgi:hypothetical protein
MENLAIHFLDSDEPETPCNVPYAVGLPNTDDWNSVTCGRCRLEQPEQNVPGRVEYAIPSNVTATDVSLADQDRERGRHRVATGGEERTDLTPYVERLEAEGARTPREGLNGPERDVRLAGGMGPAEYLSALREWAVRQRESLAATERMILRMEAAVDIRTELDYASGMTHFEKVIAELSQTSRSDLISARSAKQGAKVVFGTRESESELKNAGLVGENDGLTRTGTIVREKLIARLEDGAF